MSEDVVLNEREQLILQAVVSCHISTAEPVGSRTIVKRFGLDWSPATVRNVMADLEEAGYLEQVHTSSGRVPTDRGYRYYVDYLMREQNLALPERARIEKELSSDVNDVEQVVRQSCRLLAFMSHQTCIVESPDEAGAEIRRFELVSLAPMRAVAVVADSLGRVRTMMVNLEGLLEPDELPRVGAFLNDVLRGAGVQKLTTALHMRMRMMSDIERGLAEQAMRILHTLPSATASQLFLDGATQLFEQPEFRDVAKAREVFTLLDERERLSGLLRSYCTTEYPPRTSIVIGSETHTHGLEEISLVASPYCVGERTVGVLGVLGPRRMPYPRVAALVHYTAGMLSRSLTYLAGQYGTPPFS